MGLLRILIADDHEVVRRGLRSLLSSRADWEVCGEAVDGREAVQKAKCLKPDLVVLDISMPHLNGLDVTRIIRKESPQSEILILSQHESPEVVRAAREAGARGYVVKADISRDLLSVVEAVSRHRNAFSSNVSNVKDARLKEAEQSRKASMPGSKFALSAESSVNADFLAGGGEMAARMRSLDWSKTKLGPIEQWPQSLKTSISICLASRFPIVMYWGSEYVVLYNDAYSTILGGKHPWALGQSCRDCWAEIWDTIGPMLEGVVSNGEATWSKDLLLPLQRHAYSEECYFSFSFSPIRVETGGVGGVFTAVMETTEKVIGERRLRTLRDQAASAVHVKSEPDAWRVSAESLGQNLYDIPFSILFQPSGAAGFSVVGTAGISGTHSLCRELSTPGSDLSEHLRHVAQSREMVELKDLTSLAGALPTGAWEVPPESALLLPIGGSGKDRISGVLFAAVSPRKALDDGYRTFFKLVARQIATSVADARSQDEERKRAEALAEIDRAKTRFFSNVSHEFRTPLTLMLGPLEDTLATADGRLCAEDQEKLLVVHRNSLRLLKLVNSLLDFSRIEAGRVQAVYEPTDLSNLTAELASVFRAAMERSGLRFLVKCEPLPDPIYVDRDMWEKIVLNLLSNAFKYTFKGEVSVTLKAIGDAAVLEVKDSGTGIAEHELPRLFERFHRVEGARGRTLEGTGIGLALVQELVKLHSGSVTVRSQPGKGSTFTVSIPRGKKHLPKDRIEGARPQVSTAVRTETYVEEALQWLPQESGAGAQERSVIPELPSLGDGFAQADLAGVGAERELIVLADDNADMREYVRRLLSQQYRVHAVSNGEEALAAVRDLNPDLILTDVMMPGLDGFGVLRLIRQDPSTAGKPVILLSARAGEESRVEGLEQGADDYLVKPFTARELLARVGAHLAMARLRREAAERERHLLAKAELELAERTNAEEALKKLHHELENRVLQRTAELVKATEALKEQAQLLELAHDAIIVRDLEGRISFWNHGAEKVYGWTSQEALGKVTHTLFATEFPEPLANIQRRLLQSGSWEGELAHSRKDGSRIAIESRWVLQYNEQHQPMRVLEINRDVTQRTRAEKHIAEQAQMLDLANDAIFVRGVNNKITYWNRGAERLYGWKKNEVVGRPVDDILHTEFPFPLADITKHLQTYETWEGELKHARRDGTWITVSSRWTMWTNEAGEPLGFLEINTDVSERKLAEQNLRALSARLLQLQDEERRRIARELHDSAGQLLVALDLNLASVGTDTDKLGPESTRSVAECKQLVQELSRELRTISHLLHPPLLDEAGLPSAVRWYVDGYAKRSKIPVKLELAPDLGRLPRDLETTVFRIVQECLTNVHRHSESPTAEIRILRRGDQVTVEVRDQGKGMSSGTGGGSPKPVNPGVGIQGMHERVRQLGGQLDIQSVNGHGTLVRATLPVGKAFSQDGEETLGAAS